MSVSEVNSAPSSTSCFFRSVQFSTMPFITTCTRPDASSWGWQFASVTRPWVAQRVWAMPLTASLPAPLMRSRRFFRGPTARTVRTSPFSTSEKPAES